MGIAGMSRSLIEQELPWTWQAERVARAEGKTLLVLDTASPDAERLYTRGGWLPAGVVPSYALLPQGGLCDTRFFYKALA